MSGLEEAIRKALDNAERENANVRARIYQSARQALERGLSKQEVSDPKVIARQRRQLDDAITQIEREEAARVRSTGVRGEPPLFDDPFAVGRTPDRAGSSSAEPHQEPYLQMQSPETEPPLRSEPSVDMPLEEAADRIDFPEPPSFTGNSTETSDFTEADFTPEPEHGVETGHLDAGALGGMGDLSVAEEYRRPKQQKAGAKKMKAAKPVRKKARTEHHAQAQNGKRKKRGIFASGFMIVIALAFIAAGAWWIMQSGFTMNPQSRDTAVPNPPPRIEAEDFEGASTWTPVFMPGQTSGVSGGAATSAENVTVDGEPALRISANATGDNGAVRFRIPPAVINMLEDGPVLVEATVVAPQAGGQQVAIACYDGTIQGCQRHRYMAPAHRDNLVIQLRPNGGALPSQLMITSDVNGTGIPLDIFAIRARAVDENGNGQ